MFKYDLFAIAGFIIFSLSSCESLKEKSIQLADTFWVSNKLNYYKVDSATGFKPGSGSGKLIYFANDKSVRTLIRDFYWENVSIQIGGEPGLIRKAGNYQVKAETVILNQELIEKTFLLPTEKIGMTMQDNLKILNDSMLISGKDTLIRTRNVPEGLKENFNW